MTAEELLRELPKLDPVEFERFRTGFQSTFAHTTFVMPGIEKTPGVCGGSARVAGTRIPVWSLIELRRLGASDQQILENFPSLTEHALAQAWEYGSSQRAEIEKEIAENNEEF